MLHSKTLPGRRMAASSGRPQRRSLCVTGAVKEKGGKEVLCSKTLIAIKGKEEQVAALCKQVEDMGLAQTKDRASGVLQWGVLRDQFEPTTFYFHERYQDAAAFSRATMHPEMKTFMQQVNPLLERPIGIALYEYRNGKIGAVCMNEGPKGEGGLDDATGASGAAGGASMKQTSNSIDLVSAKENHFGDSESDEEDISKQLKKQVDTFAEKFTKFTSNVFAGKK